MQQPTSSVLFSVAADEDGRFRQTGAQEGCGKGGLLFNPQPVGLGSRKGQAKVSSGCLLA